MHGWTASVISAVLVMGGLPVSAKVVTGQVVTIEGFPIRSATVKVVTTRGIRILSVDGSGAFRTELDCDEPSLKIEITAAGFNSRQRTLVFHDDVADGGRLIMDSAPTPRARSIAVSRTSDRQQNLIDVLLENPLTRRAEISAIRIRTMKKKRTHCLDATRAALSFEFGDTISGSRIAYSARDDASLQPAPVQSVETTGDLRLFPCDQIHLDLDVAMPFMLSPGEVAKLRFMVPSRMKVQNRHERVDVDLTAFATVAVAFQIDGREVVAVRTLPQ